MKNKWLSLGLTAVISLSLMACGSKDNVELTDKTTKAEQSDTKSDTKSVEVTKNDDSVDVVIQTPGLSNTDTVISSEWVDLEDRSFELAGKKYVVGQTTFQELIDDKVITDETALEDAGRKIPANSATKTFDVSVGKDYVASLTFGNFTDDLKKANELPLQSIDLVIDSSKKMDKLTFDFPLDMTPEQLLEIAGEPTSQDEAANEYEYKIESKTYLSDSGYFFKFNEKDQLIRVTLDFN